VLKKVGVHIDVSPYAPLASLSRFFYALLLYGVVWDPETGSMVRIFALCLKK
jgi:hypothetical protein